ncbi:hypothetical protein BFW01_g352 [Lasiodiplodia theobromae]|uniref:Oxidase ustYa n=1 Tax=Lasiodiplodia theobromae TaxID=45133 RepID=A0A5N5CTB5_9PEZI|nr:Oxidase ustYa [Lasiodiplodia theobromae]KAF9630171.1 hypothetical protein BFW01_g352 [Lasiodiplodia theobromae]
MAFSFFKRYKRLPQDLEGPEYRKETAQPSAQLAAWTGWTLAAFFAFTTALLVFRDKLHASHFPESGSFSAGFKTEFGPVKPLIKEEPVMFWGGPRWYDNGTGYKLHNPSEPEYVGPPNDDMDEAWETLLKGRYFTITDEEAVATFGPSHQVHNHSNVGYLMGLDVYHTLHCVDQLRRMLDREHYFGPGKMKYPERGHRDHCLDHIRQQLMCHADLTPIPVIWYEGHGRSFVQSDVVHTCRNWGALQKFMHTRADLTEVWAERRVKQLNEEAGRDS